MANFESTGIRRTALRYDTRTEASSRYEKAVDPERCDQALALSMHYFQELYPELKVTGFCDNYVTKLNRAEIDVSLTWLAKRLGKNLSNDVIRQKLELLGFDVSIDGRQHARHRAHLALHRRHLHQGRRDGGSGPPVRL